jgi:AAA15 family ATPase/GTPase
MESVTLDLEAGTIREFPKNVFKNHKGTQEIKLLKNVTLFGANSSGKTNFLRAFSLMRYWVLRSYSDTHEGKKIPVRPFVLNTATENGPSHFEVHFLIDRTGYRYGFLADKEKVHEEWLFITTKRKEELIFTRSNSEYRIDRGFQGELKQRVKMFIEFTKPPVLFLTVLAQWQVAFAENIVTWFLKHRMYLNNELDEDINITADLLLHPAYRETIYKIIKQSDLGFATIKEELDDTNKMPKKHLAAYYALNEELLKKYKIKTRHERYSATMEHKGNIYFDLEEDESAGARKFVALLGPIVRALIDREIIWIDELDARLHTMLVNLLVLMINSPKYNNRGAQAIITTHNVQLFKKLRRDQMFLLEKNKYGISAMSSVYVGKPHVRGDAILDKEYLNAQLGGIPNISEQLFLDFDSDDE